MAAWTAGGGVVSADDRPTTAADAADGGAPTAPAASASPDSGAPASSPPAPAAAPSGSHDRGDKVDYTTKRYELAGFPLIGGDSDIGFEFGGVATLSRFANGVVPYEWNMDLLLAASIKSGPSGIELTQQNIQWNIDVPGLADGRVRINPQVAYNRTINQLYFGIGNASSSQAPPGSPPRYFEFDDRQARVRALTRIVWRAPLDVMVGAIYRFEDPGPYYPSKLATDAASGVALGVGPLSLLTAAAGIVYDTRDNEIFPRRGSYHQVGLRGTLGVPTDADVRYGEAGAMLATYKPVGGPFTLALRAVIDLQFGKVPAYDLYTGGPFQTYEMPGGSAAIRGVPEGRYSGLVKLFGNAELRALLVRFQVFGQRFRWGGNLLFDTGRLWANYTFSSPLDGRGIGLKWGAGLGSYLVWGQAAVFRIEVAYSPDAASENPNLPLGIYVEDGVMF
ncbi:MAG TPA: BamA/TamA family outer membrane protein [Polyangiaceae bacterium]|nr:BamA/TamA family outer membrane protein [Polyangiaceae bacterium]